MRWGRFLICKRRVYLGPAERAEVKHDAFGYVVPAFDTEECTAALASGHADELP